MLLSSRKFFCPQPRACVKIKRELYPNVSGFSATGRRTGRLILMLLHGRLRAGRAGCYQLIDFDGFIFIDRENRYIP